MESSAGHFLALKRVIRKSITYWDPMTVSQWLGTIGFERCMRIVKFGRISGQQLATADYDFMRDTLGLPDENMCNKLKGEVEKVRDECIKECALLGWGKNSHGQLATRKLNFATAPKRIVLPEVVTLDETKKDMNSIKTQQSIFVDKIACGNRFSAFILSNGETWACGNCPQAGKPAL